MTVVALAEGLVQAPPSCQPAHAGIGRSYSAFLTCQVARRGIIRVSFVVRPCRRAAGLGAGETIQRVVAEGLRLRVDGIRDRGDIAHRIVRVGIFLQASRRKNFQPSALLVPGAVDVVRVNFVRVSNHWSLHESYFL